MNEKRVTVFLNEDIKRKIVELVREGVFDSVGELLESVSGEKWDWTLFWGEDFSSKKIRFHNGKFSLYIDLEVRVFSAP